jgi:aminoglycoside phosphotransferase (APT) family kinase protein
MLANNEIKPRLERFLKQGWSDAEQIDVTEVTKLLGGWSKQMYSFDAAVTRGGQTERLPLILRINAPDNSAILRNSRHTEHLLLERLRAHTKLPVPRSYLLDRTGEHFGGEAMIIERLPGNPRITQVPPEQLESVAEHLVELMAALHTAPLGALNPDGLLDDPNGWGIRTDSWDDYVDSMCQAWIKRYQDIAFDTLPVIYDGFFHLRHNKPRPLPLTVVHGELNPNNLITSNGKVVGLIDWERPHVGDPREDLAWFRYFEQAMAGTNLVGAVKRDGGYLGYYNKLTGFDVTEEELSYFTIFSHSDVSYGPYSSINRGLRGEHDEITATYFIAEAMGAQMALSQLMQYAK